MLVYTLLHPLSAERSVLNGKLLTLIKMGDESNPNPTFTVGDQIKIIDVVTNQPLFLTSPLITSMIQKDNKYMFQTSANVLYTLIDVRELIPTQVTPPIETEDLIVSQIDKTFHFPWGDIVKEHRFVFAKSVSRSEFIHMCINRGYQMVKRDEWHRDHTAIKSNNKDLTDWTYQWVQVSLND